MAGKSRSKPATRKKVNEQDARSTKATSKSLDANVEIPPQVFVLPENLSPHARIVTITNAATAAPVRHLVCPERGIYEFTSIASSPQQHKSWLLAPESKREANGKAVGQEGLDEETTGQNQSEDGYVLRQPEMLLATPVDPLFIVLPALVGAGQDVSQEYLAVSDYLVQLTETSRHLAEFLQPNTTGHLQREMERRVVCVCDCVDMGDERRYALSLLKLTQELFAKARRMTANGLPASLEDHFVKKALEVPVLSMKREQSSISIATDDNPTGFGSQTSEARSQESDVSGTTSQSVATSVTSVSVASSEDTKAGVVDLLRLRVALEFLMTSYISPSLRKRLMPLLSDPKITSTDFSPLDEHLDRIASLKKEAQALRSLSDNISRKRSATEDDEDAMERAETKRRKQEEETLRKKNMSHGVKKLAKADTSGMKKLSAFFAKGTSKK